MMHVCFCCLLFVYCVDVFFDFLMLDGWLLFACSRLLSFAWWLSHRLFALLFVVFVVFVVCRVLFVVCCVFVVVCCGLFVRCCSLWYVCCLDLFVSCFVC